MSSRGVFDLPSIQKPQGAGKRDGVEHVRADGEHHIDGCWVRSVVCGSPVGTAGVGGGVRHDKSGAAFFIQRGVKELNPEIVRVVRARQSERDSGGPSRRQLRDAPYRRHSR